ncbi:low molecular weight phosphotyrosine protein phosphatase [Ramlibacter sp. G-1-2-2]|uniref:protein-tyrosine-phosphatase n=1 Tax=Ramlibacter agri TaxID=2728837 RepID=A0A848H2M5_9BURK|nr:low molecular weight protein-tyrosine-phosphatase [Ramlibacter agri]NML43759.1 low molecular weight phosphotyrosine protein phosphatase [Ramlibacter agri]
MKGILVLCEGNICRSPMGAALLARGLPDVRVQSAGLNALVGSPADKAAVELMRERGLDITGHRALQVTRAICQDADMVLVMDAEQRKRLLEQYPEARGKVFRMGEYTDLDVPDPYRQPMQAFRNSLTILDVGIQHWLRRIQRL